MWRQNFGTHILNIFNQKRLLLILFHKCDLKHTKYQDKEKSVLHQKHWNVFIIKNLWAVLVTESRNRYKCKLKNTGARLRVIIILNWGFTFQVHNNTMRNKLQSTSKLFSSMAKNSYLSIKIKIPIYTFYLKTTLTYASIVWSYAAKSHVKLLIKDQNSTIQQILDMIWHVQNLIFIKKLIFHIWMISYNTLTLISFTLENIDNLALNTMWILLFLTVQ